MQDRSKTKVQLLNELKELRQHIVEQEASETERRKAEEALRESEMMFQSLISQAPFSVWVCDGQGTITFANQAALDLFGVTDPAKIIGHYNIYRDTTGAEKPLLAQFERALAGEVVHYRQDLDMTAVKYDTAYRGVLHFHSTLFPIPAGDGRGQVAFRPSLQQHNRRHM